MEPLLNRKKSTPTRTNHPAMNLIWMNSDGLASMSGNL